MLQGATSIMEVTVGKRTAASMWCVCLSSPSAAFASSSLSSLSTRSSSSSIQAASENAQNDDDHNLSITSLSSAWKKCQQSMVKSWCYGWNSYILLCIYALAIAMAYAQFAHCATIYMHCLKTRQTYIDVSTKATTKHSSNTFLGLNHRLSQVVLKILFLQNTQQG